MLSFIILHNGNLKLTANNAARAYIKENMERGYWAVMASLFEDNACNGSYTHFGSGNGNPFVGLTDAPCIAECMACDDDGNMSVEGRLWAFLSYAVRDDLGELKNRGFVIYQLVA